VNQFADYTDSEAHALLGHRPMPHLRQTSATSLLEVAWNELPEAVDWREKLNSSTTVKQAKDQGNCGSCWAVAAAGALETHAAMTSASVPEVSNEQITDCTPNPKECGGQGGCNGATAELALGFVTALGVDSRATYHGYHHGKCSLPSHPVLTTTGFVRLLDNMMQPLLQAVALNGPVVVSADASKWFSYSSGVFNSCPVDAIINHAILCMGYGRDAKLGLDYWLIRNSWGPSWGENGYVRLLRDDEEGARCGTDKRPQDGVACKGGPETMRVCGMCGILADSVYPTGVKVVA